MINQCINDPTIEAGMEDHIVSEFTEDDLFLSPPPSSNQQLYMEKIYNLRGNKSHNQKPKIKVDHIDDNKTNAITEYKNTGPQLQHDPLQNIHTQDTSFADVGMNDDLATVSRRNINEETISNLDLSNIEDRFIQFLINKFEYLNLKQLSVA